MTAKASLRNLTKSPLATENDEKDGNHHSDSPPAAGRNENRALEELLECAEEYDRATGPSFDAEEWFRGESESLLHWAKERGRFLPAAEFGSLIEGFNLLEGGLEHQVFFQRKSGRVVKITKTPHFGHTWYLKDYVRNLLWCNAVFEDDIQLEGVIQQHDGMSIVISQPYIHGRSPSDEEVEQWFLLQHCVGIGKYKWRYPDGMVVA
ncbi:MAG TPA: hypothetical protein VIM69_13690, partial [Opitutaceae bacterium]